jgi:hypothetical protein
LEMGPGSKCDGTRQPGTPGFAPRAFADSAESANASNLKGVTRGYFSRVSPQARLSF